MEIEPGRCNWAVADPTVEMTIGTGVMGPVTATPELGPLHETLVVATWLPSAVFTTAPQVNEMSLVVAPAGGVGVLKLTFSVPWAPCAKVNVFATPTT
jgi:hypothetical protein